MSLRATIRPNDASTRILLDDDYLALNYSVKYDSLPPPGKMPAFVLTSQPPLELLPPGEVQTECMISPFVRQKLLAIPRYQRLLKPLPHNSEPLLRMSTSGKGVYATRAIEAKSLIIDERPFMLTPVCPPRVPIVFKKANMTKEEEERIVLLENEKTLRNVLERMPEWRQEAFLKLPNDYTEVEGCGPISGILRTNCFMIGAEVFMDGLEGIHVIFNIHYKYVLIFLSLRYIRCHSTICGDLRRDFSPQS